MPRPGVQLGDINCLSKGLARFRKEQLDDRVGAAKRLETAISQPTPLSLRLRAELGDHPRVDSRTLA